MALIQIKKARGTWLHLFKAQPGMVDDETGKVGDPKFNGCFIIDRGSDSYRALRKAMEEVAVEKWGANGVKIMDNMVSTKLCLRDGDKLLDKDGNGRPEFAGKDYIVASSKTQPGLFSNRKDPATGKARVLTEADGMIYGGCYVNLQLDIYTMDDGKKVKGVFASLRGVQFAGDGDRLGGNTPSSADEFDAEEGEAEDAGF